MKHLLIYTAVSAILVASLYSEANTYTVYTKEGTKSFEGPTETIKYLWSHEGKILRVVEVRDVKLGRDLKFKKAKALAVNNAH